MADPWDDAGLAARFRASAVDSARRAPLNAALARIIAVDRSLAGLLAHAPPPQRLPVLLFAAIHHALLTEPDHELAQWYPTLTPAPLDAHHPGLAPALRRLVDERLPMILDSVATRSVQTNEIGRTSLIVAALSRSDTQGGRRPLAHLDVGASAGLNLLLPRFDHRFVDEQSGRVITRWESADPAGIELECSIRGSLAASQRPPEIVASVGLDRSPLPLDDEDRRRWLLACIWPDQADRFHRLERAIELAVEAPPDLRSGDAVDDLLPVASTLPGDSAVLLTTTWVLNYLDDDRRHAFVATVDELGRRRDVIWVSAEAPAMTAGLPHPDTATGDHRTFVTRVEWRDGIRSVDHVGVAHPHGYWLHTAQKARPQTTA